MKLLLLAPLLLFLSGNAQNPKIPAELLKLRDEYVKVTSETKESIQKLLPFYETDVVKAEERLEASKRLLSQGEIARAQVEEHQRGVVTARDKLVWAFREIAKADRDIANAMDDDKFFREYKQAVQQRRKARKPRCTSWRMTVGQQTTQKSVVYSYRFVCQN